jgi:hypothetical protein
MLKNELSPLKPFYVCDVESFKWMHLICMGLTDGEQFWEFGVNKTDYIKTLQFKSIAATGMGYKLCYRKDRQGKVRSHSFYHPKNNTLKPWKRMLPEAPQPLIREAMRAFVEQLTWDCKDKDIYAHFGGKFDFLFVLNYIFFNTDFKVESMIPRGSGLLCFDVLIEISNGKTLKLTFHDSSALLPFGLKSITKNFGVPSMKTDWDHRWSLPYMTEGMSLYNKTDCLGLHQSITKYFSQPLIKRAGGAYTIAGQAMRVLRTKMDVEISSLTPRIDAFVRRAYFGGRVEIFKPLFLGPGKIRCADVNSLYPTVMRDVPEVGDVPREYPAKFSHFDHNYHPNKIGFYEAEVLVPDDMYCPPLGVVWEIDGGHKFIFPTGKFRGYWSTLELEYARSLGVKILRTGKGAIFEGGGNFFKRYVDDLYELRENSPRESVDNVIAKLLLNSCYGRFGLKVNRENLVVDEGQVGVKTGTGGDGFVLEQNGEKIRLVSEPKVLTTFTNVAVSAWVTSASRVFMHRHYMKILSELYYTDTDSLFTTHYFPDQTGLGGLKIEYEAAAACFLLPKSYVVQGVTDQKFLKKVTMKGFDKQKTKGFTVEDFQLALEGDLRRLHIHQEPKFATFKTALGKGKILHILPKSERQIRSLYDKRVIEKTVNGYDTRAHKIKDSEPIWTPDYKAKMDHLKKSMKAAVDMDEFFAKKYKDDSTIQKPDLGNFDGDLGAFFGAT